MDNGNPYVSSIIHKYGDTENVSRDAKTLHEILNRQGSSLLIDVIANHIGENCIKFKISDLGRKAVLQSNINELREAILERI